MHPHSFQNKTNSKSNKFFYTLLYIVHFCLTSTSLMENLHSIYVFQLLTRINKKVAVAYSLVNTLTLILLISYLLCTRNVLLFCVHFFETFPYTFWRPAPCHDQRPVVQLCKGRIHHDARQLRPLNPGPDVADVTAGQVVVDPDDLAAVEALVAAGQDDVGLVLALGGEKKVVFTFNKRRVKSLGRRN